MKKFQNSPFREDIELEVIYTVTKIKLNRKTKEPVLDENNQPIIIGEKEIYIKHIFRKDFITVKAQTISDAGKIDHTTSEIFETSTQKTYRTRIPYKELVELLKREDEPLQQIGFKYKNRK